MTDDLEDRRVSLDELHAAFDREITSDKRAAAETAYALAFRYRNEDVGGQRHFDIAKMWAARAIGLLDSLPSSTLAEVASTRIAVGGVPIPELLHSDVVRDRLGDVLH
ncbi:hypothetical protein [Herbihabitans rhizosphaerae]|uniref:hypothetical protein n=1 Tax=Herbihabitans rhizosphaerae TaxID=1872711 RepID=UPI00102D08B4|nr:hypothetical protein [Herbihabitans rhizosphaerae]